MFFCFHFFFGVSSLLPSSFFCCDVLCLRIAVCFCPYSFCFLGRRCYCDHDAMSGCSLQSAVVVLIGCPLLISAFFASVFCLCFVSVSVLFSSAVVYDVVCLSLFRAPLSPCCWRRFVFLFVFLVMETRDTLFLTWRVYEVRDCYTGYVDKGTTWTIPPGTSK